MSSDTFQKSYDFFVHLYQNLRTIPKRDRFTWGSKTEGIALQIISLANEASYLQKATKRPTLIRLSQQIDLLKIILRLGYDLRILDQKKYIARQAELQELGRMVGGWLSKN